MLNVLLSGTLPLDKNLPKKNYIFFFMLFKIRCLEL